MKKINNISIIGCGWLGLELAKSLISDGNSIKGSTTSQEKFQDLKSEGINPFLISLTENGIYGNISSFLEGSEILIINVPPGLRSNPKKNHVREIEHLILETEASKIQNVLFVSSTTVYEDSKNFKSVTEDMASKHSNSAQQLLKIEELLHSNPNFKTTVLRFGGLFAEDRHPAKYLSGRSQIKNPDAPINLIHRDDCISIITKVIESKVWGTTLNAVIPEHPSKKIYYVNYCKTHNLTLPNYDETSISKGKKVSPERMVQLLDYGFKHGL